MHKIITTLTAISALSIGCHASFGESINPQEISSEADWYLHLDIATIMDGPTGELIQNNLTDQQEARLRTFERIFGFDPLNDLHDITLWGVAEIPEKGLVIIDANFEKDVLLDLLRSAEGFGEEIVAGQSLYTWIDEKKGVPHWGAFYGESHVLVSDNRDYVKMGLDVLSKRSPAMTELPFGGSDLDASWLLGYADMAKLPKSPKAAMIRESEEVAVELGGNAGDLSSRIKLRMRTQESAVNLEKIATGFLAMASMDTAENPERQFFLDHIEIQVRKNDLMMNFDAPMDETIQVLLNRVGK